MFRVKVKGRDTGENHHVRLRLDVIKGKRAPWLRIEKITFPTLAQRR